MTELLNDYKLSKPRIQDKEMGEFSERIEEMLKESRDVAGITAEYIMTFLDRFDDDKEQLLIFALCSNFHRIQQSIEQRLLHAGIDVVGRDCDTQSFESVGFLDADFMEAIGEYLSNREKTKKDSLVFQ